MAVVTASATTPGSDCQVPNPKDGILAPVFNSKNLIAVAAISRKLVSILNQLQDEKEQSKPH